MDTGGLLTIQAYILGLAPAERLAHEVEINIDILLLVTFIVACVHFLKNLLLAIFTNLLVKVESKVLLSIGIMLTSAVMSAVMDALSVAALGLAGSAGAHIGGGFGHGLALNPPLFTGTLLFEVLRYGRSHSPENLGAKIKTFPAWI